MKISLPPFSSSFKSQKAAATVIALGVWALYSQPLKAATLYWDGNSTTAGAGTAPTGTWGTDAYWSLISSTNPAPSVGTAATTNTTTTLKDDVYFSAGTDAVNPYTVTLNGMQSARVVTIEEGSPTFTGGTLNLASSGGGITVNSGAGPVTVSSNVTITGSQIFNTASGTTLAFNTGTFTRNAGATLNVQGAGVSSTQTNLNNSTLASGIIGPWASIGTSGTTRYATFTGTTISALTGTTAATTADLTNTDGTVNYDLTNAAGNVQASMSANTIRYAGSAAATTAPGSTLFSVNGLMNAGSGIWTIGTNALTIGANQELVVNAANRGITITSAIQDNINGASALTKMGAQDLTLSGNNTYTGVTYITQGVITVSSANALGIGAGNTIINSNGNTSTGGALALSNVSIAEDITLVGPGDGIAASYSSAIYASSGTSTITGVVTLSGATSYRLGSSGTGVVMNFGLIQRTGSDSSSIVFSPGSGSTVNVTQAIKNNGGALTAHAGGTVILSASGNEIGQSSVQNKTTLKVAATNALATNQTLQIGNSSGTATGDGNDVGTFFLEGVNQTVGALNGYSNTGGTFITASNMRKITSSSASNSVLTVGNSSSSGSFDGVIENGSGGGILSFTKTGTVNQTLTGTVANTYTGLTTVNGGNLILAKTAGINAIAGNITLGDGTGNDVILLNTSNQIADTSIVTFNGTGANAGILRLNNQSETLGGLSSTSGAGIVENESGSAATGTLTVDVATGTSQSFSGILRNGDGAGTDGTLAFAKNGSGTQVLSGASTYSGGTTVNTGNLQVNNSTGSATGSGPVLINTTATLSGTGSMGLGASNRATINGILSPGNSTTAIESLEFNIANATGAATSGLTLNAATLAFDLGTAGASISAVGLSDQLLLTGTLNENTDLSFTGANTFNFGGTGATGWYKLVDTSATSAIDWSGLTIGADRVITAGLAYTNLGSGQTGTFYLGNGSIGDFGDIYFQVVPEPGRALLLMGGLLAFTFRRRR